MIEYRDGHIVAGIDSNKDGENSVSVKLSIAEALQEGFAALKKGEKKEIVVDVKSVRYKFEDGKIIVEVDTDKDGEALLTVDVDMAESFEEIAAKALGK